MFWLTPEWLDDFIEEARSLNWDMPEDRSVLEKVGD